MEGFRRRIQPGLKVRLGKPSVLPRLEPERFDGLLLPGGHAPGMRQYLGSAALRGRVLACWCSGRPVGAICHGVLVLARTIDPATGQTGTLASELGGAPINGINDIFPDGRGGLKSFPPASFSQ